MTFQRLLIMSIYHKKKNNFDKYHRESGNYGFSYALKHVFKLNVHLNIINLSVVIL